MNAQWLNWIIESPLIIGILLKMTVLLLLAWAGHFALRRANPRWRVVLWRSAAVGLLAVPVLAVMLPSWNVAVVPSRLTPATRHIPASESAMPSVLPAPAPYTRTAPIPQRTLSRGPHFPEVAAPATIAEKPPFSFRAWIARNWSWIAVSVWALFAVPLAFRVCLGWWRVRGMMKGTIPAPNALHKFCAEVASALGVTRPVEVRISERISSPFLTGLRRPRLILPKRMAQPAYLQERRAILAHELSHLRSNDLLWGYVLRWLTVAMWFHPLVWRMRTAHASACEEVSDAVAAHFLGDSNEYSRTLARVALEMISGPPVFGGIPMARVSDITRRLRVLRRRVFSSPLPRRSVIALLVGGLLAIGLLSGLRLAHSRADDAGPKTESNDVKTSEVSSPSSTVTESDIPKTETAEDRGQIRGIVVNSGTGEPISGAQVAIGHHLSDNDVKRIREQGAEEGALQLTTNTDTKGRFVLGGLAFWDYHLFSVKCPGFVPHEEWVAVAKDKPEVEVRINLKRAATIKVKVLDAEGMPLLGQTVRIESKDGHALLPARGDWRPELSYRTQTAKTGSCSFEALPPGIYSVEAMVPGASEIIHHGAISTVSLHGWETKEVELEAVDKDSLVEVKIGKDPHAVTPWQAMVVISRHPALLAWATGDYYHPEDHRLARIIQYMVNRDTGDSSAEVFRGAILMTDGPFIFRNFPPDTYALLALTFGKYKFEDRDIEATYVRGARVRVAAGKEETLEIPWVEPRGPSPLNPRLLSNQVKLEAKEYGAQELCDLISKTAKRENVWGSEPQIIPDTSIRDETLELPNLETSLWNLVETIYLEKGWKLVGDFKNKRLVLRQTASVPVKKEEPRTRGQIRGLVVNSVTGEAIAGAYVAVDHSGDAGGTNLGRFREQGIYATTETNQNGRFLLDGVAFRDDHPFMVTHPGFVRHQERIALKRDQPELEVRVRLRPAATLVAKIVDADGELLKDKATLRLEAKDGRPFFPLKADWPDLPYRSETTTTGTFSFGELDTGVFSIEAMRIGNMQTTYHAKVSDIAIEAGETEEVLLEPADHRSTVKIKIEKDPHASLGEQKGGAAWLLTARPGLLAWANRNFYHPEDERLGRVWKSALIMAYLVPVEDTETLREVEARARVGPPSREGNVGFFLRSQDMIYTLRNFPPGEYAVFTFAMGMYQDWKSPAVYMRGVKAVSSPGKEQTVEIPYVEPIGPSPTNARTLYTVVNLEARAYTAQEICELLLKETGAKEAQIVPDSSIENEEVALPAAKLQIWDLLETLYLKKGWTLEADYKARKLVLRPGVSARP